MVYDVLINRNSGTVLKYGEPALHEKISQALGEALGNLRFLPPAELTRALKERSAGGKILVGGGDGTINSAASILKDKKIAFGILPLGTMNMVAKDLGLPVDMAEAAKLYRSSRERLIDTGRVNGHLFLCNAMLGVTTDLAREREKRRKETSMGKWIALSSRFFKKLSGEKDYPFILSSSVRSGDCHVKAIVVSNNKYAAKPGLLNNLKESLNEGRLAVYMINPHGTLESAGLLSRLAAGNWQDDTSVEYFDTEDLILHNGRRRISVLIDGELREMSLPLKFTSQPGSLAVLVPGTAES